MMNKNNNAATAAAAAASHGSKGLYNDSANDNVHGDDDGGGSGTRLKECAKPDIDIDIDFITLSYDVNAEKPHQAIFDAAKCMAMAAAGDVAAGADGDDGGREWKGEECVHVGDDLEKDYWGARMAGWRGVWLDRVGVGKEREGDGERVSGEGGVAKGEESEVVEGKKEENNNNPNPNPNPKISSHHIKTLDNLLLFS